MLQEKYIQLFHEIKHNIRNAQLNSARFVNRELVSLYWHIGELIVREQTDENYGKAVVEKLSVDLAKEFPSLTGFSARNLWEMRKFYQTYSFSAILQQLVAELPWGHNLLIMNKINTPKQAEYYIRASINYGWSRNVLLNQIKADAYTHALSENKTTNFQETLPEHLAEQATEMLKNSYTLEFLGLNKVVSEYEIEQEMVKNIRNLIIELGFGFAFVGNQYKIKLGENSYFIDLLFFHRKLQCLVAIELKAGKFKPEHAAKLNFYLEILDDTVKLDHENPSLGILLCAEKDNLEVEYALRIVNRPIGVSEYKLSNILPEDLRGALPTPEDFKKLLQ